MFTHPATKEPQVSYNMNQLYSYINTSHIKEG